MTSITNWLYESVITRSVKLALDKLPLNGYKTAFGVVLALLTLFVPMVPSVHLQMLLSAVANWLISVGVTEPQADTYWAALVVTLTGLIHKGLKYAGIEQEPKVILTDAEKASPPEIIRRQPTKPHQHR